MTGPTDQAEADRRDSDCPSPLHDHPLPHGYVHELGEGTWRVANGWGNEPCPLCGMYGWIPPEVTA